MKLSIEPWFKWPDYTNDKKLPIAIIGAGIAGCFSAHFLTKQGFKVILFDEDEICSKASGNKAAIVMPLISHKTDPIGKFYQQSFLELTAFLDDFTTDYWHKCGALELSKKLNSNQESKQIKLIDKQTASKIANVNIKQDAFFIKNAGYAYPKGICNQLIKQPNISFYKKTPIEQIINGNGAWEIKTDKNNFKASSVILACANNCSKFIEKDLIDFIPVRGQVTYLKQKNLPASIICNGQYITPNIGNNETCIGASYERNVTNDQVKPQDDLDNINAFKEILDLSNPDLTSRASVRASVYDRRPVIGPIANTKDVIENYKDIKHGKKLSNYPDARYMKGLYINSGHGSRGMLSGFMGAKLLTSHFSGNEISKDFQKLLHPSRFLIRKLKKL